MSWNIPTFEGMYMICLHLMCSSICSLFLIYSKRFYDSCPQRKLPPPTLKLTLILTLTLTGGGGVNFPWRKLSGYHSKNRHNIVTPNVQYTMHFHDGAPCFIEILSHTYFNFENSILIIKRI